MEELDVRQRGILRLIVQEHIATGEPVALGIAGGTSPSPRPRCAA
jgi:(2Fe-2S) ferredoxin